MIRAKRSFNIFLVKASRLLRYRESSVTLSLIVSAVTLGVLVGLAAVAFDAMVHFLGSFIYDTRASLGGFFGSLVAVLIPALGGLLITPIVVKWSPDVRGSGIPFVMLAVSNFAGRIPKRIAFWRPVASTISIGTGASLGTEGPVVQMGASIASIFSDMFKVTDERRRNLAVVATASGYAAAFNAPIAGVMFSLEVILGNFGNRAFASVVIGAVAASAVSRNILGRAPAFAVPDIYTLGHPIELFYYALLGVLAAFVGILLIRFEVWGEQIAHRLKLSDWLRPTLGGLFVGLIGLGLPQVLGRSYEGTEAFLNDIMPSLSLTLLMILGKMLATSISLASFGSGGTFAPLLFIGAAFGGGFGQVLDTLGANITPGAFALVGMSAVFSSATRAPISSIILMFELSNGYQLILPLLIASVLSSLIADIFHPESVYQIALSRKGLQLQRARHSDVLQSVKVKEVMAKEVPILFADDTLDTLRQTLATSHHNGFIIVEQRRPDEYVGIITLSDLEKLESQQLSPDTKLFDLCQKTLHTALPDETISSALERMSKLGIGRMPVVEQTSNKLLGFVQQSDLAKAYAQALGREREYEQAREQTRLRDLTGQEIIEVKVKSHSGLAGKTLKEARLPKESIIVAIRRDGTTVFPHGDTRLEPGDMVVANVAPGFERMFKILFE
ncbi:MAG: chloride channel protein [Trueperaceae bacterium]